MPFLSNINGVLRVSIDKVNKVDGSYLYTDIDTINGVDIQVDIFVLDNANASRDATAGLSGTNIETNKSWTAAVTSDPDLMVDTFTTSGGPGYYFVGVAVTENTGDDPRSCEITYSAAGMSDITFTLCQNGQLNSCP